MSRLSDVSNKALRELLGNYTVGLAVPASAASATTFKTTQSPAGVLHPVIDGQPGPLIANLTTTAPLALAALQNPITGQDTFYVQPSSTTAYYLIVTNKAGTIYVIQGTYLGQTFKAFKNALGDGSLPDISVPALYAPLGAFKIVLGTTSTFTLGTNNLDATTGTGGGTCAITWASINRLGNALPTFA